MTDAAFLAAIAVSSAARNQEHLTYRVVEGTVAPSNILAFCREKAETIYLCEVGRVRVFNFAFAAVRVVGLLCSL